MQRGECKHYFVTAVLSLFSMQASFMAIVDRLTYLPYTLGVHDWGPLLPSKNIVRRVSTLREIHGGSLCASERLYTPPGILNRWATSLTRQGWL